MIELTPNECRVLGVLVEKAQTTPGQYPMSLNAIVVGGNQKSNRDPVLELDDDAVMDALDSLRAKKLASQVMLTGSRVDKFKHNARDGLGVDTRELVILTELLLRGPQTVGELRGRATRMYSIDSIDIAQNILDNLMQRDPPLVRSVAPAPGSRAIRYGQLLCPELHPLNAPAMSASGGASVGGGSVRAYVSAALESRIAALESQVAELQRSVEQLTAVLSMTSSARAD